MASKGKLSKCILLFDVDGTLTESRLDISPDMHQFMMDLNKKVAVGLVGGSDLKKIDGQLLGNSIHKFPYIFSENGVVAYKKGELINNSSILEYLGEDNVQRLANFCLRYIADLQIPQKRGTFFEFRRSMINVSPIGRNCSQEERIAFFEYDKQHEVRKAMIDAVKEALPDLKLTYAIGGQISFDVFPHGWNKTYCLQFLQKDGFEEIHFFGDKTFEGGNDHEIFMDPRTIGHTVTSVADTKVQVEKVLAEMEAKYSS